MTTKPLRIAMVAPPFYEIPPKAYGGIEAVLAQLVDAASEIACSTSSMPEPHLGTRTRKTKLANTFRASETISTVASVQVRPCGVGGTRTRDRGIMSPLL